MTNDGINPEASAPDTEDDGLTPLLEAEEEAPEAQNTLKGDEPVCQIVATFDRHSPHIQLNINAVEPTQIWSLVGLLSFYAEQMYAEQLLAARRPATPQIQPVAAIPQNINRAARRRGN